MKTALIALTLTLLATIPTVASAHNHGGFHGGSGFVAGFVAAEVIRPQVYYTQPVYSYNVQPVQPTYYPQGQMNYVQQTFVNPQGNMETCKTTWVPVNGGQYFQPIKQCW